jgi:hypothetical protein
MFEVCKSNHRQLQKLMGFIRWAVESKQNGSAFEMYFEGWVAIEPLMKRSSTVKGTDPQEQGLFKRSL